MLIAATSEYESIKQQNFSLIQENEQLKIQLLRLQVKGIEP
jgi:hypothetical protein